MQNNISQLFKKSLRKFYVPLLILLVCCQIILAQEKTSAGVAGEKETRPLSFAIVVDNSASFRMAMDYVITTTQAIAAEMGPGDEASLVRFIGKDKIEITQDLTANKNALIAAADDMYVEGGQTAVPEALLFSAQDLLKTGKNERKILLLITDGDSKSDKKVYAEAVSFLKEKKIPVFIVGITMLLEGNTREAKKFLERVADDTGGTVVFVDNTARPAETAAAIMKAVRAR